MIFFYASPPRNPGPLWSCSIPSPVLKAAKNRERSAGLARYKMKFITSSKVVRTWSHDPTCYHGCWEGNSKYFPEKKTKQNGILKYNPDYHGVVLSLFWLYSLSSRKSFVFLFWSQERDSLLTRELMGYCSAFIRTHWVSIFLLHLPVLFMHFLSCFSYRFPGLGKRLPSRIAVEFQLYFTRPWNAHCCLLLWSVWCHVGR